MSSSLRGTRLCLGCGHMLPEREFRSWTTRTGMRGYATRCKPCEIEARARMYRRRALERVERSYRRRMAEAASARHWQEYRLAEQQPLQFKD